MIDFNVSYVNQFTAVRVSCGNKKLEIIVLKNKY